MTKTKSTIRSVQIDEDLWAMVLQATVNRTREEGAQVSASELIRRGLRRELHVIFGPGWYRQPKTVKGLQKMARGDDLESFK